MNHHRGSSRWGQSPALVGVLAALGLSLGSAADAAELQASLRAKMADIARVTRGPVGAAVMVVEGGHVVALHGEQRFPMQSVYKLPIAMAVLRQVDRGALRLDQRVKIGPGDLAPPSRGSQIRDKYPNGTEMTVSELMGAMMGVSDGTASDLLLKLVGGPGRVTAFLRGAGCPRRRRGDYGEGDGAGRAGAVPELGDAGCDGRSAARSARGEKSVGVQPPSAARPDDRQQNGDRADQRPASDGNRPSRTKRGQVEQCMA